MVVLGLRHRIRERERERERERDETRKRGTWEVSKEVWIWVSKEEIGRASCRERVCAIV